jgi:hypothetical protein
MVGTAGPSVLPQVASSPRSLTYRSIRKRRQRTPATAGGQELRDDTAINPDLYPHQHRSQTNGEKSTDGHQKQDNFASRSVSAAIDDKYHISARSTSGSEESFHVEGGPSQSLAGEDSLTVRRREANRLAAQRFRNRKKGYQDNLEERIRQLEEERDVLSRRLGDPPAPQPPRLDEGGSERLASHSARPSFSHSLSSHDGVESDMRVASLEAANRRLQDEVRDLLEENEVLREEVDNWRRWDHDGREAQSRRREDGLVSCTLCLR